ncbi:MAG TPA: nucleotide-binding protein [Verrucomicrobiae bacterium]
MKHILSIGCLVLALLAHLERAAAQQPAAQSLGSAGGFSGKVAETMDAGEYTYVRVDTGKTNLWAVAPKFAVKVGDTAAVAAAMPMANYHSKSLNRDFEVVYFADHIAVHGAPPMAGTMPGLPKDHPPIAMPGSAAARPKVDLSGIKKPEGGKTVAEIYGEKSALSGKEVKVRGKVVKFNGGILGKNWLHLRDGTGSEGSNDLLVTSKSEAKVGDTVLATGVLVLNKDFGANYKYSVMIEDANVTVE